MERRHKKRDLDMNPISDMERDRPAAKDDSILLRKPDHDLGRHTFCHVEQLGTVEWRQSRVGVRVHDLKTIDSQISATQRPTDNVGARIECDLGLTTRLPTSPHLPH